MVARRVAQADDVSVFFLLHSIVTYQRTQFLFVMIP